MSPTPILIEKNPPKNVEVALAPTHNIFSSLLLLARDEPAPGDPRMGQ